MTVTDDIPAAKERLPLPLLLEQLGLGAHAKRLAFCPLHENRKTPAFSTFQNDSSMWLWTCHAGCGSGDEITFLEKFFGLTRKTAIERYLAMAGTNTPALPPVPANRPRPSGPKLPDDAAPGTEADWRDLAALRRISYVAAGIAAELGTLYFGTVCGSRSWIITDEKRLCAEARRMDGKPFPPISELGERKAHTIRGSVKSWPVGLAVRRFQPNDFRALSAVEGSPDYLAALHFTLTQGRADCLPIAFLGAGSAKAIHQDALELLRGARVRFYAHHELSGAGLKAVTLWAAQLAAVGASYDAFSFADLRKADGSAVKDLNDCTQIHPEDAGELEGLLP